MGVGSNFWGGWVGFWPLAPGLWGTKSHHGGTETRRKARGNAKTKQRRGPSASPQFVETLHDDENLKYRRALISGAGYFGFGLFLDFSFQHFNGFFQLCVAAREEVCRSIVHVDIRWNTIVFQVVPLHIPQACSRRA